MRRDRNAAAFADQRGLLAIKRFTQGALRRLTHDHSWVQSLIDELASEGLGVVLISSDAEELIEGADRVVVLRDGVVVGTLTGDQVTAEDLLSTIAAAAPEDTNEH